MNIFDRIKLSVVRVDYWLRNSILKLFSNLLFNNSNLTDINKVIIFRTGSMGDSICALPAINVVRKNYPNSQIDILTNAGASNLVSIKHLINKNLINNIIDYLDIPKSRLTQLIRKNKYDLFIELPQDQQSLTRQLRNIIWVKMLGIKKAFGWEVAATRVFPIIQAKYIKFENERDRLVNILRRNNFKNFEYEYPLNIDQNTREKIKEILIQQNLIDISKNISFVVGAKRPQNRWPIEYFKEVIKYVIERKYNAILIGDNADRELTKEMIGNRIFNFCGEFEPLETAELMKNCKIVVSNDTGPMHLSYSVGTPVIALFSKRDYANKWFPPLANFVQRPEGDLCVQCLNECKFDNFCLKQISPSAVIELLKKSLMSNRND